ncbi:hypothetical protein SEA_AVOCADO_65 [Mycobacterium phage Avocado]|uniref:Uncharacterized protein n=1 Tax=Mycobacterium phage Avocado TaxID=2024302 RepID=A0A222Z130_9CAUD|nr:hypothetical protein KDW73_gp65 [Mycobacterium phage Avocado]ASR77265.1 hypothetical protein SEA_AVOCADO_65 [Mycobacterium phage Avocado]
MPERFRAFDRSGRDAYLEGVPDVTTRAGRTDAGYRCELSGHG